MNLGYRKRYCKYSFIASTIILVIVLFSSMFDTMINANYIAILSIFSYVVMIAFWILATKKIDFYTIFLSCTYIFYYGRYLLVLLNRKKYYSDFISYYNEEFLNSVAIFVLICIVVMNMSFAIFMFTRKNYRRPFLCRYKYNINAVKVVAWTMFLVSFLFSIQIILINIRNTQMFSYAYALKSYYSGFRVERFFSVFLPGSFILLVLIYKNSKMLKIILCLLITYFLLYFSSGSRLQAILLILALLLVYELEFKHLTKTMLIKLGIGFLAICFLLVAISSVRNSLQYSDSINEVWNNIQSSFENDNFLLKLINECGFQINSIAVVLKECPSVIDFNFGMTYLNGFGQLIPNLFWSQNPFMQESKDSIFAMYMNGGTFGIGSSFIAEAYYNFGYLSVGFMIFVGWLFSKYQLGVNKVYMVENNLLLKYFYLSIPTFALFYVRSDAVGLIKAVAYRCFIPCIAIILLSSIFKKPKEYN